MKTAVRWPFIIALGIVSLIALMACDDDRPPWEKNAELLAPLPPTDISVWCKGETTMQAYPYRDLEKQGCYRAVDPDHREWLGKIHCTTPARTVGVECEEPELSESEAVDRWERFNQAVESYRHAKGQK